MKKWMILLLVALMLPAFALADRYIVDEYSAEKPAARLTDELCRLLTEETGETYTACHAGSPEAAADMVTEDAAGEHLLLCGLDPFIRSLQGYTAQDLRTALRPAAAVAAMEAYLYVSGAVINACPGADAEALSAFCDEMDGEVLIARLPDADTVDYLTLQGTWDFYADQEYYMSWQEAADAAADDTLLLLVCARPILPEEVKGGMTEAFPADTAPVQIGLYAPAAMEDAEIAGIRTAVEKICAGEEWLNLCGEMGYSKELTAAPADFDAEHAQMLEDIIHYLSQEGLYFYEF